MSTTRRTAPPSLTPDDHRQLALLATTIRGLAIDGVQEADSGHPGLPMGMADSAALLWHRFLRHNPADPHWSNRDRFVLSGGHGSMLLYSLLHLAGYDLPMAELKRFRQFGSRTPGHPEVHLTAGVETTTGPLGQGISNAVGMAIAERWLAARFNRDGYPVVDHHTFVIATDGDMMEGISHESCSLAGHLGLGKLIVIYDDNRISIDGETNLAFSEDVLKRFESYGWHTQRSDGHDLEAMDAALKLAIAETGRPSIIAARTEIGHGSPNKAGTAGVHGSPLGPDEVKLTKERLGLPTDKSFFVPDEARFFTVAAGERGQTVQSAWTALFEEYRNAYPEAAAEFEAFRAGRLPEGWDADMPAFEAGKSIATRKASGSVLEALTAAMPNLIGGSADLTPSNNTQVKAGRALNRDDFTGSYIHYGVREHGMGAIMNGMALHGGVRPFGGTFLVFSDYMRGSIRLAALMEMPVIYVFTHDSIGLGEDGPTHQPVEHLAGLRAIPNLVTFRPADAAETVEGWRTAITRGSGPTALVLTRQGLPVLDRTDGALAPADGAARGGYAIRPAANPDLILLASGSEVQLALEAAAILSEDGVAVQVVSMPSPELFDVQDAEYRAAVLPPNTTKRVAVEAGATLPWYKYVGMNGRIVGLDRFGASAPWKDAFRGLGITTEAVVAAARDVLR